MSQHENVVENGRAPESDGEAEEVDSDEAHSGSDYDSESYWEPPYSVEELVEIFLDLYTFLSRLHYEPSGLLIPPQDGWSNITPEKCAGFGKCHLAIEVMRRLPYLVTRGATVDYKSILINYSNKSPEWFASFQGEGQHRPGEHVHALDCEDEEVEDYKIAIAVGWESGGLDLILDLKEGEIIEEMIRYGSSNHNVKQYFTGLKEKYATLQLMPCVWRDSFEPSAQGGDAKTAPERDEEKLGKITWDEYVASKKVPGARHASALDVQWLRQTYRAFGWPGGFRQKEFGAFFEPKMKELERMEEAGEIEDAWYWMGSNPDYEKCRWEELED